MVLLILVGCGLEVLFFCTTNFLCLVDINGLVVSVLGSPVAQEMSGRIQAIGLVAQGLSADIMVNLV